MLKGEKKIKYKEIKKQMTTERELAGRENNSINSYPGLTNTESKILHTADTLEIKM